MENHSKSEQWLRKLEDFSEKRFMLAAEDRMKGDRQLAQYHAKIAIATRKKAAEIDTLVKAKQESLKKFERQAERKELLEQLDAERRQEVAERIREKLDQVETIEAIKQGILDQRRHRVRQAAALKGQTISLQDVTPGPSDYVTHESVPAIRLDVGTSIPKAADLDVFTVECKRKSYVPGPGTYSNVNLLKNGNSTWCASAHEIPKAPKDTVGIRKGVELEPGPGHYFAPSYKDEEIVKLAISPQRLKSAKVGNSPMVSQTMADALPPAIINSNIKATRILPAALPGRVSTRVPSYLQEAMNLSKQVPGPGQYRTDKYLRKANWMATNKSLPVLQKALQFKSSPSFLSANPSFSANHSSDSLLPPHQAVKGHTRVRPLSTSTATHHVVSTDSPQPSPSRNDHDSYDQKKHTTKDSGLPSGTTTKNAQGKTPSSPSPKKNLQSPKQQTQQQQQQLSVPVPSSPAKLPSVSQSSVSPPNRATTLSVNVEMSPTNQNDHPESKNNAAANAVPWEEKENWPLFTDMDESM